MLQKLNILHDESALLKKFGLGIFIRSIASGIQLALLILFVITARHLPVAESGTAITQGGLIGLAIAFPLSKWMKQKQAPQVCGISLILKGLVLLSLIFLSSTFQLMIASAIMAVADYLFFTTRGLTALLLSEPDERAIVSGKIRAILNGATAIGSALASIVIAVNTIAMWNGSWIVCGLGFIIGGAIIFTVKADHTISEPVEETKKLIFYKDIRFLALCFLNIVVFIDYTILTVGIPIWISHLSHVPDWFYGIITALGTLVIMATQMTVSKRYTTLPSLSRALFIATILLAFSSLALTPAEHFPTVLALLCITAGMIFGSLGEIYQMASLWMLSFDLAPEDAHGQYQGMYNFTMILGISLGPGVITYLISHFGSWSWIILAFGTIFAAAVCVLIIYPIHKDGKDYSFTLKQVS